MLGKVKKMLARRPKPESEPKRKADNLTQRFTDAQDKLWSQQQRLRILEKRSELHRE